MKKILLILFLLGSFKCYGNPSNTMSITPVAVASATIEADDENTRNNAITTAYNAHDHTDISSSSSNDWIIGDGQTSNKSFSVDNADANNPALRFNDSSDIWESSNDGVTFTEIITNAGTQSLAGTKTFTDLIATTADINGGTIDDVTGNFSNGILLPSGAVFYMITGSCPAGTTDITSAQSGRFLKVNATGGTQAGTVLTGTSASHTLITAEMPAHTHTYDVHSQNQDRGHTNMIRASGSDPGGTADGTPSTNSTGSGGGHTHGLSGATTLEPKSVTAKLCQVD